jgi:primosomal protein N' (replication factor Y)
VIVGTRSAIFMPLPNLGLIILDEEHDSSYKQDVPPLLPRAHRRPLASWLENCPLVLGSATPSLDTLGAMPRPRRGIPTNRVHR